AVDVSEVHHADDLAVAELQDAALRPVEAQLIGLARLAYPPHQFGRESVEAGPAEESVEESHGVFPGRDQAELSRRSAILPGFDVASEVSAGPDVESRIRFDAAVGRGLRRSRRSADILIDRLGWKIMELATPMRPHYQRREREKEPLRWRPD